MRFIPTRIHGMLDYASAALLIALPFLLGFQGGLEMWLPISLGAVTAAMSLMTNYEAGVAPVISVPTHLTMDFLSGVLLAASPWAFDLAEATRLPFVVLGLMEVGAALCTQTVPMRFASGTAARQVR